MNRPRLRPVQEGAKFRRERPSPNRRIDAVGECLSIRVQTGAQQPLFVRDDTIDVERTRRLVACERDGPENL